MSSQASPQAGWTPAVGDVLSRAGSPQSVAELRRSLGSGFPGKPALQAELRRGVESGLLCEWPGRRYWFRDPDTQVRSVLKEAVAAGPELLRRILRSHKADFHKLPAARVTQIVDAIQADGELHVLNQGKDRLVSLEPLPDPQSVISSIAGERPFPKAALVQRAVERLRHLPGAAVAKSVDSMVKSGDLRQKGKGKSAVFFARPADVTRFLSYIVSEAVEQATSEWRSLLEPMGLTVAPVSPIQPVEAVAAGHPADLLLAALRDMEPQRGLPVAIQKLRRYRSLVSLEKRVFDQAAVELVSRGRAFPFHHTAALTLPADERDQLVDDGHGTYYVGLAWRD